ncbi:hypothetical protein FOZ62_025320 [Perkinsus olseni]|uniref:Uncharacterized protein n=1 Tax=Perkinsus olseni TaxID=32597 RepID=A0A7J6TMF7_PEROL|nr:hypothetical protein FOZ62_025320 [Perkinsus olseni]
MMWAEWVSRLYRSDRSGSLKELHSYLQRVKHVDEHPEDLATLDEARLLSLAAINEVLENPEFREDGPLYHKSRILKFPGTGERAWHQNSSGSCTSGLLYATYNVIRWSLSDPNGDPDALANLQSLGRNILMHYIQFPGNEADTTESSMFPFTSADLEVIQSLGCSSSAWQVVLAHKPGKPYSEGFDSWKADYSELRGVDKPLAAGCSGSSRSALRIAAISEHMQFVLEAATMAAEAFPHQGSVTVGTYFAKFRHVASEGELGPMRVEVRRSYEALWDGLQDARLEDIDRVMADAWMDGFWREADAILCVDVALWICGLMHHNRPPLFQDRGMIVYSNTALLCQLPPAVPLEVVWKALDDLINHPRTWIASPNKITAMQIKYQLGLSVPVVPATGLYVQESWSPRVAWVSAELPRVLVWRCPLQRCIVYRHMILRYLEANLEQPEESREPFAIRIDFLLHDESHLGGESTERQIFRSSANRMQNIVTLVERPLSLGEIAANYQAVVLFPWEPFMLTVTDLMGLGIPVFIPDEPLLHRFVLAGSFPYGGVMQDPAQARARSPNVTGYDERDPFQFMHDEPGVNLEDRQYWLARTDFVGSDWMLRFKNVPDLLTKLQDFIYKNDTLRVALVGVASRVNVFFELFFICYWDGVSAKVGVDR